MDENSQYLKISKIADENLGSCDVYHMKPGGHEKKHYHNGIEIVHVLKGSCKTHKRGQTYIYQKGDIHEVINDSNEELIFVCLTIPPESDENTIYVEK